jgi:hypothetical protein
VNGIKDVYAKKSFASPSDHRLAIYKEKPRINDIPMLIIV